jgi:RNA polymerase sigma factor (sigma-70 family)
MQDPSWPSFLDLLDSDPNNAFADIYRYAVDLLTNTPPRPMRSLPSEDRQDLIHQIVFHCVANDFQVMRRYINKGKPFSSWFYATAHNKCLDYLRAREARPKGVSIHSDSDNPGYENILSNPGIDDETRLDLKDLIDVVRKALTQLGENCRLLLEMAADGFTPREMVTVLRLPPDQNKKVSDNLRYCRRLLKKELADMDIDINSILGS